MTRHRVLVVDDSAFARKVLREVLSADPRIEVVGFARDGLDALEKIEELKPDVLTLDLVMPELDGVGVLEALAARPNPPRVVIVTMTDLESPLGVRALQAGAFDVVHKPTALATDRLYEIERELVDKVILAATSTTARPPPRAHAPPVIARSSSRTSVVVIGASTGGPRALTELLGALPADFPVPIACVLHMPAGYTQPFAERLDASCALRVVEAAPGEPLLPGTAMIARAGAHLRVHRSTVGIVVSLDRQPASALHCPSVDVLFESAASAFGSAVLGVVLTGMGTDGLAGARAIHAAGGALLVESRTTAVVWGMPRAVAEARLQARELDLPDIAAAIAARV